MTIIINERNKNEIGYQTIFWLALFAFRTTTNYHQYEKSNFQELFYYDFFLLICQIVFSNFIYFVLIKKYFDHRKYVLFLFNFILSAYLFGVVCRIFIVHIAEPLFFDYPKESIYEIITDIKYLIFHYLLAILSGSFIFISLKFMLRYRDEKQNAMQLQKEKKELELKMLKSQLNPHFLFNTLNNIYSLSIINSDKTSESISRLSDILDYILYKGQNNLVSVKDEMKIISDYIELEKLRYDDRLSIEKNENIEFPSLIPPLLYLSVVENAFKHGAEKTSGEIEIQITVAADKNGCIFKVENSSFEKSPDERPGIGLENIKKQLRLNFQNQYSLKIKQEKNTFSLEIFTPRKYD